MKLARNARGLVIILAALVIASAAIYGLGVMGESMMIKLMYQPGLTKEYKFTFVNNDDADADYELFTETYRGSPLENYVTAEPKTFKDVKRGQTRDFTVSIKLPQSIDTPGENEQRVWVKGTPHSSGGGMTATPVVGIRFIIFVLFPYKYVEWQFSPASMNVNESADFTVSLKNLGEPDIGNAYADIEIMTPETQAVLGTIKTNAIAVHPREEKVLTAKFSSRGYPPGDYLARATLHYDENTSVLEAPFKVGSMDVAIRDFTKEFNKDSINKMVILAESRWNNPLDNLYADVEISDLSGAKISEFKSLNINLLPWQAKNMEAYFDTRGLPLGNYSAKITLYYKNAQTVATGIVSIVDEAAAEKVTEVPKKPSIIGTGLLTSTNLLILILIIFIMVNVLLLTSRKGKKAEGRITDDVVKQIKLASSTMPPAELLSTLKEKGWSKDEIDEILERIRK